LRDIDLKDMNALISRMQGQGLSPQSIAKYLAPVRAVFGDAVELGDICDVFDRRGEDLTEDEVWVAGASPSQRERECLRSLFAEPIKWYPSAPRLTNGQHRVCGL
jgi:hypothetical protein